jgi:hypothetical protein
MPGLSAPDRPPAVEPAKGHAGHGLPLKPVTDSSDWKAADFRHDSWIASLNETHVKEIEIAIDATIHAHEGRFGRGTCLPPVSSCICSCQPSASTFSVQLVVLSSAKADVSAMRQKLHS